MDDLAKIGSEHRTCRLQSAEWSQGVQEKLEEKIKKGDDSLLITTQGIEDYNNLVVTMSRCPTAEKDDSAVKVNLSKPLKCKEMLATVLKEWGVHNKKLWLEELGMEDWIM